GSLQATLNVLMWLGLYSMVSRKTSDSINPSPKTASLYIGFRRPHPKALFFRQVCHSAHANIRLAYKGLSQFDVFPDGKRIVVSRSRVAGTPNITLIENVDFCMCEFCPRTLVLPPIFLPPIERMMMKMVCNPK